MKIKVLPEYPFPIVYGGIEIRSRRTINAIKDKGIDISFLDYYDEEQKFDLLHIFGNPPSIFELVSNKKNKKVVISSVNGFNRKSYPYIKIKLVNYIIEFLKQNTDYHRLKYSFQKADAILCLNELEKEFLIKLYNLSEEKIFLVHNGVDDEFFNASPHLFEGTYNFNDFILYTGNIVERKNPLLLAKTLNDVGLKGVFIGSLDYTEKKYRDEFLDEIAKSNKQLLWISKLDLNNPLLPSAYAACKLFCLPSISETQPQSALEALVYRKKIILGNMPYAYQWPFEKCSKTNFNKIELKNKITEVLSSSLSFQKDIDTFRWSNIANRIIGIYKKILS